jgi:hypothetical protein
MGCLPVCSISFTQRPVLDFGIKALGLDLLDFPGACVCPQSLGSWFA